MAKLDAKERKALPSSDFAVAGRRYPIEDKAHAKDALARVAANGTPAEIAAVHRAVRRKYPDMVHAPNKGK